MRLHDFVRQNFLRGRGLWSLLLFAMSALLFMVPGSLWLIERGHGWVVGLLIGLPVTVRCVELLYRWRLRAVAASVLLFIQTIIGLTIGPYVVGWAADILEPTVGQGPNIAYPMAVIGVVNLWAALHYFLAARRYRDDLAETAKLNAATA